MRHLNIVYVNGYGVPMKEGHDGKFSPNRADANYDRYLAVVANRLRVLRDEFHLGALLVFAGGATNPDVPQWSEGLYMHRRFTADHPDVLESCDVEFLSGQSVDENLYLFRRTYNTYGASFITMFCEWARQDYFRYRVARTFPSAEVVPVTFDRGFEPRWSTRLQQWMFLPLRMLNRRVQDLSPTRT